MVFGKKQDLEENFKGYTKQAMAFFVYVSR